ncbi:MAG: SIS domain-containing protein [Blastocatellia bacterium]|nr:SIS domain-containing protein [Blastocatellia bacterium]
MTNHPALRALYPFLPGAISPLASEAASRLEEALLESVRQKARESIQVKEEFFAAHAAQVVETARAMAGTYQRGGRLLTIGNGGSSCDAAHIAVEFLHPITAGRPALSAVNLAADPAMMTAVGNDVGFAHIFRRQVIAQGRREDALLGVSTSGNAENLLAAFAKAKEMGMVTIGLAGGTGGRMRESADVDHCLVVESDSVHRVQECHVAIYHILWDLAHTLLAGERGGRKELG